MFYAIAAVAPAAPAGPRNGMPATDLAALQPTREELVRETDSLERE
jgi:hypothetical protein